MKTRTTTAALLVATACVAVAAALAPAAGAADPTAIKVHGRWTITVHDRNGKIVSTRRFENSLVGEGQLRLISLLWGVSVAPAAGAGWSMTWLHQVAAGQPKTSEAVPLTRRIHISGGGWNEQPQNQSNITLWGTVKASAATRILGVGTNLRICAGSSTAAACSAPATPPSEPNFTYKELDNPLPVAAGQTIDFTVVLYLS